MSAGGGTGARRNEARRLLGGPGRPGQGTRFDSCCLHSREGEFAVRDSSASSFLAARGSGEGSESVVGLERHFIKMWGGVGVGLVLLEKFSLDLHNTIFRKINNHPYSDIELS